MADIIIAIDGYASCGKSTLAKALANELGYLYIDSGAMYRAVTHYFSRESIGLDNRPAVMEALGQLTISFQQTPSGICTFLNGDNVEKAIRTMEVAGKVSLVAAIPEVRRAMVRQQQELGKNKGIAMDGRDIGTVVFPAAELKIFLTAATEERVNRRALQLGQQGIYPPRDEIRRNLLERDYIDSTRSDSPLTKAREAVIIDNTNLSEREQLLMVLALATERIQNT